MASIDEVAAASQTIFGNDLFVDLGPLVGNVCWGGSAEGTTSTSSTGVMPAGHAPKEEPKRKGRDEAARSRAKQARKKAALKELEDNLQQKSRELDRLQQENFNLKHRHNVLDRIIKIRNHQLSLIRQPKGNTMLSTPATLASNPLSPNSPMHSSPPSYPAETTIYTRAMALLGTLATTSFDHLSVEQFRNMSSAQFVDLYKSHLFKLSEHLQVLEGNARTQAAAAEAEKGLMDEACMVGRLFKFTSLYNPDVVSRMRVRHLESGKEVVPTTEHWRALLQTLALTPEQQLDMLGVAQLYQQLMSSVLEERVKIQAAMSESGHNIDTKNLNVMMRVPMECQVLNSLFRNLRQEQSLGWMVQGFFYGHACSVLQFSKAIAYAYPYMPDAVAIVMTLWSDMEEQGTLPNVLRATSP